MADKYSKMDEITALGFLANAMFDRRSPDGDSGASFPRSDAEDFSRGVRFVPGEVTLARRRGERVNFVVVCTSVCWYWEFQDGTRIYHWDRNTYEKIARQNGHEWPEGEEFSGDAGSCPNCGNSHTTGGTVKP